MARIAFCLQTPEPDAVAELVDMALTCAAFGQDVTLLLFPAAMPVLQAMERHPRLPELWRMAPEFGLQIQAADDVHSEDRSLGPWLNRFDHLVGWS